MCVSVYANTNHRDKGLKHLTSSHMHGWGDTSSYILLVSITKNALVSFGHVDMDERERERSCGMQLCAHYSKENKSLRFQQMVFLEFPTYEHKKHEK